MLTGKMKIPSLMKLTIIDDSKTFRRGLRMFLTQNLRHEIIAEAGSGLEALQLVNIQESDIILLDIQMDNIGGFETAKKILKCYSDMKIIALSMHDELIFLTELIKTGFYGYVSKGDYFLKLPTAIEEVKKGKYYFPEDIKF